MATNHITPGHPVEKNLIHWHLTIPLAALAVIVLVDVYLVTNVSIAPLCSMACMALLALKARPMPTTLWVIVFTSVTSWLLVQQRNTLDPINVQFVRIALRTATLLIGGVATVLLSIHRRRLFQSHEHLLGVLRKIPAPLVLSNSSGTVIFVNEQAASMLGLAPEEAEGLSYFALFVNRSDKGNAIKHYLEMVEQEEQTASSIELRLRDRPEVPMKGTLVPLASGGDRWIITLISARQDAENQTLEGITAPVHP